MLGTHFVQLMAYFSIESLKTGYIREALILSFHTYPAILDPTTILVCRGETKKHMAISRKIALL